MYFAINGEQMIIKEGTGMISDTIMADKNDDTIPPTNSMARTFDTSQVEICSKTLQLL